MTSSPEKPHIPPLLVMGTGVIAASTAAIFIRYAQTSAPSLVIAAYRLSLATLILIPYAFSRERPALRALQPRQIGLAAASGVFLAAHFATWISSLAYTSVASSVVLVATAPLFVALLSTVLLHEPLPRGVRYGLGLALTGSLLVGLADTCSWQAGLVCPDLQRFFQGKAVQGDLLALAGAFAAACYMIIGRHVRSSVSLIPYITLTYGSAAVTLLLVTWLWGYRLVGYPAQTYLWFLLLALIPQLIAHSSINWALRYLTAAVVSIILLAEPIGSSLLAFLLLGEAPTAMLMLGSALILAGIAVATRRVPRK